VRFAVYVLNCNLKAIEASSLRQRDFGGKVSTKVLVDDAFGGDEVLLCCQESVPICGVSGEVNFLGSPEGCLGLLVHPPDVIVLDGKEDKAVRVYLE
jgi:hypothetical protein